MNSAYHNNGHAPRYQCGNMKSTYDEPLCQSLSAAPLDRLIADLVLAAVQPAAIEVSLAVAADVEAEAQRWSGIGGKVSNEPPMSSSGRTASTRLSNPRTDWWPARWSGPGKRLWPTKRDYKPITSDVGASSRRRRASRKSPRYKQWLRTCQLCGGPKQRPKMTVRPECVFLDRILIEVIDGTEQVRVECHWHGGVRTQHWVIRPVSNTKALSTYAALVARASNFATPGTTAPKSRPS